MNQHEIPWPKKGAKLFKEAADLLIDYAISSGEIRILDTYVFPICFLYRQYLELEMKKILPKYSELNKGEKINSLKGFGHNLMSVWNQVRFIISKAITYKDDIEMLNIVEDYIRQFHQFDKKSLKFRYLIDKELNILLKKTMKIDLKNLRERMEEIYIYFKG